MRCGRSHLPPSTTTDGSPPRSSNRERSVANIVASLSIIVESTLNESISDDEAARRKARKAKASKAKKGKGRKGAESLSMLRMEDDPVAGIPL